MTAWDSIALVAREVGLFKAGVAVTRFRVTWSYVSMRVSDTEGQQDS